MTLCCPSLPWPAHRTGPSVTAALGWGTVSTTKPVAAVSVAALEVTPQSWPLPPALAPMALLGLLVLLALVGPVGGTWNTCRGVSTWEVVIGTTDLTQPGPESKVRHIQRLLVHQHYVAATARNDIALVELDQPVECSDYIQLGCVPDASLRVSELKSCYIAGWDFAKAQGSGMVLQESKVHLVDTELCNSSRWYAGVIHPRNLCAGYPQGSIDTCQGDSGGPLVCKDNEADYFWLVGMSSWGRGCERARHPGIYTSTQHFYNWILLQTGLSPAERAGPAPEPVVTSAPEQRLKPAPEEDISLTPEYSLRPALTSSGTLMPMAFPHQILVQFRNLLQEFLQFLKDKKA
ncbi:acrosin-like isoform X2 [Corvus kubaryi]|uniref:acrosin-like isoform X2 n=1 Tax=Corvus kubaryi TaxID=68294 RepID=UPI001C040428|nr:acrosin-like isoform X2 [Corvus kubaryi]